MSNSKKEEAKILMFKEKADQMEQVNRRLESKNEQLSEKIQQLQQQLGGSWQKMNSPTKPGMASPVKSLSNYYINNNTSELR